MFYLELKAHKVQPGGTRGGAIDCGPKGNVLHSAGELWPICKCQIGLSAGKPPGALIPTANPKLLGCHFLQSQISEMLPPLPFYGPNALSFHFKSRFFIEAHHW
jgi:hypothetical protein